MKENIKRQVDALFDKARDRKAKVRENPVTGGRFVPGLDPMGRQKLLAQRALEAKAWFEEHRPDDASELPLTYDARERFKGSKLPYLVSVFARSLAYRDYRVDGHPKFDEYARAVMASEMAPAYIREDAQLLRRYPPKALERMGPGLIWRGR